MMNVKFFTEYSNFAKNMPRGHLLCEFDYNFSLFLHENFGIPMMKARPLASTIGARMSGEDLYYHTPLHILSIFSFAEAHRIPIPPVDRLALWVHDAICVPFAKDNEARTAEFFRAVFEGTLPNELIQETEPYIMATSKHTEGEVDPKHALVMDLDICSFAFPEKDNESVEELLRKEFFEAGRTEEQYLVGRNIFLKKLLEKGFIYRTKLFNAFNAIAIERVKKGIRT